MKVFVAIDSDNTIFGIFDDFEKAKTCAGSAFKYTGLQTMIDTYELNESSSFDSSPIIIDSENGPTR